MLSDLIPALDLTSLWPPGQWLQPLIDAAVLGLCAFVLLACVCRLRFGTGTELSTQWALLYLAVAGCSALIMIDALAGQARVTDAALAATTAAYLAATTGSWRGAVPRVARPKSAVKPDTKDAP